MSTSQSTSGTPGTTDDRWTSPSGAMSSDLKPRYDLIPRELLRRVALRFTLGVEKYGEGNYQKGFTDRAFLLDRINHAQEHLNNIVQEYHKNPTTPLRGDDDLAALGWFVAIMMERDEYLRKMDAIPF